MVDIAPGRFQPFKIKIAHADGDFWPVSPYKTDPHVDIHQRNEHIKRIIVSLHGTGGDAIEYFNRGIEALNARPDLADQTLVVAPQFFYNTPDDLNKNEISGTFDRDIIYWTGGRANGNYSGNNAYNPRTFFVRSYHVMDRLLEHLTRKDIFPNLEILILIGHSNGGQFIARYAAINTFEERYAKDRRVHIRYIPMNPGSHLYLTERRWQFTSESYRTSAITDPRWIDDIAEINDPREGCEDYNSWPHGLEGVSGSKVDNQSPEEIIEKFANRDVVYMVGENDTNDLDDSCMDRRQGENRLARTLLFYYGLQQIGCGRIGNKKLVIVPGTEHNGRDMMTSAEGIEAIFAPIRKGQSVIYIFHGDEYVRHSYGRGPDPGYPKKIQEAWSGYPSNWRGSNIRIDAALYYPRNNKFYIFHVDEYVRHSYGCGPDPGYPKKIQEAWSGYPSSWRGPIRINAALYYPRNNKFYIFHEDEYVRHSYGRGPDPGYPKKIQEAWSGWPSSWTSIYVQAGLYYPDNEKFYIFQNDEYVRHSYGRGPDPEYPKKIREVWSGWPSPEWNDPPDEYLISIDAALLFPR